MPQKNHIYEGFKTYSKFSTWLYSVSVPIFGKSTYRDIVDILQLEGNEHVLDFGSGVGTLGKMILMKLTPQGSLTCLDISENLINKTRKHLRKFENVSYVLGDIREKEITPKPFDVIVSSWVFHHVHPDDRKEIIGCLFEALKSDGRIYVAEFYKSDHGIPENELITLFSRSDIKPQIIRRGKKFIILEVKNHN